MRQYRWRVQQLAVKPNDALNINGSDPVYLLGNIDSDVDPQGAPLTFVARHPARAVFALHSDGSQSLISGRGGVAVSGELPPEPSRAASMKTIPTPPPRRMTGWRAVHGVMEDAGPDGPHASTSSASFHA